MIIPWLIVWALAGTPHVAWFGPVWNVWGITCLMAIIAA